MIDVPTAKGDNPELRRQVIRDLVEQGAVTFGRPRPLPRPRESRTPPASPVVLNKPRKGKTNA